MTNNGYIIYKECKKVTLPYFHLPSNRSYQPINVLNSSMLCIVVINRILVKNDVSILLKNYISFCFLPNKKHWEMRDPHFPKYVYIFECSFLDRKKVQTCTYADFISWQNIDTPLKLTDSILS